MTTIERTATATQLAVASMLTENTGRHMLDSGMAYGYNYERRAGVDYTTTPVARVVDGSYEKSLYWHLVNNLNIDTDETKKFMDYATTDERKHDGWMEILYAYCEEYGYRGRRSDNSYNYDSCLDGVFQWFDIDTDNDRQLVVVQTHNGCDVRGGYSTPVWFEYKDGYRDDSGLTLIADGNLWCTGNTEHRFYTDDNYHWYSDTEMGTYKIETDSNNNLLCPHCNSVLNA